MKQPKISIIVPVYQAENFLRKCIESIINQTYDNLEIILVDDGSTDSSLKICEELKAECNHILVLHKENGGLSSARNAGLEVATGDYIGFVDSDDWIEKDMFEYLYSLIKKYDVNISVCGMYREKSEEVLNEAYIIQEKCLVCSNAIEIIWENGFMCNKLFDAKLFNPNFKEKKIRFNEEIFYVEDEPVLCECISKCRKVAYSNKKKYHYVINSESITQKKFDLKKITCLLGYEEMIEICKNEFPALHEKVKCKYVSINIGFILNKVVHDNRNVFEQLRLNIKKYLLTYLKSEEVSIKFKIASILISVCPKLFLRITALMNYNN